MPKDTIKQNEWDEYEYDIQVTIAEGGHMLKLKPAQIQSLTIEKDFDNPSQVLPVIILTISKQESSRVSINNSTDFIISIDRFIASKDKKGKVIRKKKKKNILRDTFCTIHRDVTPDSDSLKKIHIKDKKIKKDEVSTTDLASSDTYNLFRKKDLVASKHILNQPIANVTMTQAITTLLSQAGVSKVLMSSLDHVTPIKELLLLPLGLIGQLQYLKNYYGWHKEDTLIFMDFDQMYLIRMNGKCTAWTSGETKEITFYVNSVTQGDNICAGMAKKGNGLYINVSADNYLYDDDTGVVEQTTGTNTIMFNEDDASVSTIEGTSTNAVSSAGTTSIRSTVGHNKYLSGWVKYRSRENSGIVTITCNNVDISQLTPNKVYGMVSGKAKVSKELKGKYRLGKMTAAFSKDGNSFINKVNLTLKKSVG